MSEVETLSTLSAQNLTARLDERDGVTVLVIGDEVVEVEISDEVGSRSQAARRLKQVAMTFLARAEMLLAEGDERNKGWT